MFFYLKIDFKSVILNGCELIRVIATNFLGALIDDTFTWINQSNAIDDKFTWINQSNGVKMQISCAIGSIYRLKDKVNESTLFVIYNTLILPHMLYCCKICGNTYPCRLKDLVLLQTHAVIIISKASYRDHATPLFERYNKLKFQYCNCN